MSNLQQLIADVDRIAKLKHGCGPLEYKNPTPEQRERWEAGCAKFADATWDFPWDRLSKLLHALEASQ